MTDSMMEAEQLLDALDEDQRRVAQQVRGPMAVLAGAGTGKTRAITYRIAYGAATGAYDPVSVLAVTFTQRAAADATSDALCSIKFGRLPPNPVSQKYVSWRSAAEWKVRA